MPIAYRRLQKIGGGSLFVTLPRSWIRSRGLKHGDLILLEETSQGSLLLSPYKFSTETQLSFASILVREEDRRRLEREVAAAYLAGKEVLKLTFEPDNYKIKKMIKDVGGSFLGLELIEEDQSSITYRFMLEGGSINPDRIFRRMNIIVKSMYMDSIKAAIVKDEELRTDVKKRDEEVDRLYFLGVRMLRQVASDSALSAKYGLHAAKALDYRVAIQHLEYMGDLSCSFSDLVFFEKNIQLSVVSDVVNKISQLHDLAQLHFFGSANQAYANFLDSVSEVQKEIDILSKEEEESRLVSTLSEFLRLIVDIADLAGTLYPYVK